MTAEELQKQLKVLYKHPPLDLNEIRQMLAGVDDLNTSLGNGKNILTDAYYSLSKRNLCAYMPAITDVFISAGFDIKANGYDCLYALRFTSYDRFVIDTAKIILDHGVTLTEDQLDQLQSICSNECYVCELEHLYDAANTMEAYYTLFDCIRSNEPYSSIQSWENACGLKLTGAVAEDSSIDLSSQQCSCSQLYLICAEQTIVVRGSPNLFVNSTQSFNSRINTADLDPFLEKFIGSKITKVRFQYSEYQGRFAEYTQPIILLRFSNGNELKITRNIGEVPRKEEKLLITFHRL